MTPKSIGLAAALRFPYKVTPKREWAVEDLPLYRFIAFVEHLALRGRFAALCIRLFERISPDVFAQALAD